MNDTPQTETPRTDAARQLFNAWRGSVNESRPDEGPPDGWESAAQLESELAAAKEDLATAIEDGNRSRQIIYAMSAALRPREGEHNIDCAKRVAAELTAAQARIGELEEMVRKLEKWSACWTDEDNGLRVKARAILNPKPEQP